MRESALANVKEKAETERSALSSFSLRGKIRSRNFRGKVLRLGTGTPKYRRSLMKRNRRNQEGGRSKETRDVGMPVSFGLFLRWKRGISTEKQSILAEGKINQRQIDPQKTARYLTDSGEFVKHRNRSIRSIRGFGGILGGADWFQTMLRDRFRSSR